MASAKLVKTTVKVKTLRKATADVTLKSVPVSAHAGEIKAEVNSKQNAGTLCAVMSLPPPTGQPPTPPGKSPRIADRAASPYKAVKKRKASQVV